MGVAQLLLDERANPNSVTKHDETPLMTASDNKMAKMVELLIKYEADVNARTVGGKRALHGAAVVGAGEVVHILVTAGADIDVKMDHSELPTPPRPPPPPLCSRRRRCVPAAVFPPPARASARRSDYPHLLLPDVCVLALLRVPVADDATPADLMSRHLDNRAKQRLLTKEL